MCAWLNIRIRTGNIKRLILVVLLISLAACAQEPDHILRIGLASAPVTLDPRFATDATSSRINRLLYARLVEFNEKQLPVPGIASWKVISPLHYRFSLGETKRTFQDDTHLTARDVKATYDSVLDSKTASPHRGDLKMIQRIEVVDENTVDFYLSRPDLLFPAHLVIGILPANKIASHTSFQRQPMGSGPFRFVSWPEQNKLNLQRVKDKQLVTFMRVKDGTVRVLKLMRGELDLIQNDLSPELITFLKKQKGLYVIQNRGSNFTYLGFNLEDPILGRLDVRRAIAMAIDRDAIIQYVMGGAARPANELLLPDHWAGNPELKGIPYNPDKARALLEKLGFNKNNPLRLTYKTSTDPFRVRLATVIQSQLRDVGINVDLRTYDWGTFYGDIKAGNFQMYSLSWVGIKTPDIFRYVFYSRSIPPDGANRGRFHDRVVDQLIDKAESATTLERQAQLYRKLQERLLEKLPYVPLWYENHVFAARKDVSGYHVGLDGNYDGLVDTIKSN
jgi:peptide/nickel transport system substrate-binding protein